MSDKPKNLVSTRPPRPTSDPSADVPPQRTDHSEQLLTEIRDLLDHSARRERQDDFSLRRLAGSLLQMLAVVAALWALAALMNDLHLEATSRFLLAVFLQLAALTSFLADRFK